MPPLLLGHRGARQHAPDNTLEGFELALAHGCDGFEFDVRRTADARSILCHDPTFGPTEVVRESFDTIVQRWQEECAPAMVRRQRGKPAPGPLSLEEVLAGYAARAFLDIELKVGGLEAATLAALQAHPRARYVISSFLPEVLSCLRLLDSRAVLGFLFDQRKDMLGWQEQPVQVVIAQYRLLSRELVEEIHARGRQVYGWTVNRERDMRRLAEWGVDGIISDDTALLGRVFRRAG